MFSVLIIIWHREFLILSNLFCILQACCIFTGMSFFRLGNFSSMILLNTFSEFLSWDSPPSNPILLRVCLFMVCVIYWMFCVNFFFFLDLTFSLTNGSVSSILSFTPESLSSITCILLMMLVCIILVHLTIFSNSKISSVCVSLLLLVPLSSLPLFLHIYVFVFLAFLEFFKGVLDFFQCFVFLDFTKRFLF